MIEYLWNGLTEMATAVQAYLSANYDPIVDTLDILIVACGIYFLLLLIRGTRAVQILLGLMSLLAVYLVAQSFQLMTVSWILSNFWTWGALIIIVLFQHDIRRGLARVGRGFFRGASRYEESQLLEEIVRAAQVLAQKRLGALMVLERETSLDDMIEAGVKLDAAVSKDLLISLFLPYSPLHDGAVVVQDGRLAYAGCVLPLTLRTDLPEGLGTRHRAALGITEETDAVVIVVSEETSSISVVAGGELVRDLDAPRLRVVLRDILSGGRRGSAGARDAGASPGAAAPEAAASTPPGSGAAVSELPVSARPAQRG